MRPAMSPGVLAGVFRWANMLNVLRDKHESRRLIHAPYQARARELCLAAGVDPDTRIERPGLRSMPAWCAYRDAARTILEGDTGLIVVDPLLSVETAKAALDLYYQHRPRRPVVAVIYTHTHADHWGGVKGVTTEADVASGEVAVLAPEGFLEHALSESVIAGNAQRRRGLYQFGPLLPKGERGQVDGGLGKTVSLGSLSLIPPTDFIRKSGEKRIIDGVEIIFATAPETEAPASRS